VAFLGVIDIACWVWLIAKIDDEMCLTVKLKEATNGEIRTSSAIVALYLALVFFLTNESLLICPLW
jgi:hypothetical protein